MLRVAPPAQNAAARSHASELTRGRFCFRVSTGGPRWAPQVSRASSGWPGAGKTKGSRGLSLSLHISDCMESRMEYIVCCKSSARDCHVRNSHWSCDPTIHYNLPKMQYSLVIHNIYLDSPVKKSAKSNGTCCLTAIVEVCLIGGHVFWQWAGWDCVTVYSRNTCQALPPLQTIHTNHCKFQV